MEKFAGGKFRGRKISRNFIRSGYLFRGRKISRKIQIREYSENFLHTKNTCISVVNHVMVMSLRVHLSGHSFQSVVNPLLCNVMQRYNLYYLTGFTSSFPQPTLCFRNNSSQAVSILFQDWMIKILIDSICTSILSLKFLNGLHLCSV